MQKQSPIQKIQSYLTQLLGQFLSMFWSFLFCWDFPYFPLFFIIGSRRGRHNVYPSVHWRKADLEKGRARFQGKDISKVVRFLKSKFTINSNGMPMQLVFRTDKDAPIGKWQKWKTKFGRIIKVVKLHEIKNMQNILLSVQSYWNPTVPVSWEILLWGQAPW